MKLELPIAVLLLATAGLATVWLIGFDDRSAHATGGEATWRAGYWPQTDDQISGKRPGNGRRDATDAPHAPENANHLIRQSSRQLHASGPLVADVIMYVNMFDQQIQCSGRYYQMGQGTRKSRLEVEYSGVEQTAAIIQICDGHIYYRYQSIGDKASLDIAYLDKVANADRRVLLADSQAWMATGGITSLLTSLANNFDFQPPRRTDSLGAQEIVMLGHWNEQRLRHLLYGQINSNFIRDQIQWDRLPPHIPASVEIHLSQTANGPIFPSRVKFVGREKPSGHAADSVTLEFESVKMLETLPDETFRVQPGSIEITDLTNEFIERVEDLNRAVRTAAATGDTFFQR